MNIVPFANFTNPAAVGTWNGWQERERHEHADDVMDCQLCGNVPKLRAIRMNDMRYYFFQCCCDADMYSEPFLQIASAVREWNSMNEWIGNLKG